MFCKCWLDLLVASVSLTLLVLCLHVLLVTERGVLKSSDNCRFIYFSLYFSLIASVCLLAMSRQWNSSFVEIIKSLF